MRYLTEPKDRIYVKGYGFPSFVKNTGKKLSNKCSHKRLDNAKESTSDAVKPASKRAVQKATESTGALTGNKIADKISISWISSKELHSKNEEEIETPKERYISPEKRWQIIDK